MSTIDFELDDGKLEFNTIDADIDISITQTALGLGANLSEYAKKTDLTAYARKTDLNSKVDKVDGKGLSANDYTNAEKNKLSGIQSGAEVNVQVDWNEDDSSSDAYIRNKPSITATSDGQGTVIINMS